MTGQTLHADVTRSSVLKSAPAVEAFESDRARRHDAEQGSRLLLERINALLVRRAQEQRS